MLEDGFELGVGSLPGHRDSPDKSLGAHSASSVHLGREMQRETARKAHGTLRAYLPHDSRLLNRSDEPSSYSCPSCSAGLKHQLTQTLKTPVVIMTYVNQRLTQFLANFEKRIPFEEIQREGFPLLV